MFKKATRLSKGFTAVEILIVIVLLAVVGIGGIMIGDDKSTDRPSQQNSQHASFPKDLEPSEFCKSYVSVSIPSPVQVTKDTIDFQVENSGSATVTGLKTQISGRVQVSKSGGATTTSLVIGEVRLPGDLTGNFQVTTSDLYKDITIGPGEKRDIAIPVQATGFYTLEVEEVIIIPSAIYSESKISCPDSQTTQTGGKFNFIRDKSVN